jgi:hypothetical protein
MPLSKTAAFASLAVLALAPTARAGWVESGDAGQLLPSAQITSGSGALTSIQGALGNANDVDLYQIYATGTGFFATLSATTVGGATFNTKLFLFDANGRGLVANDNAGGTGQSTLQAAFVTQGIYYLAISSSGNNPLSSGGQIFYPSPGTSYATGPGRGDPLSSWTNGGSSYGSYSITLTGVRFAQIVSAATPEPASAVTAGLGILGLAGYGWRRKKAAVTGDGQDRPG